MFTFTQPVALKSLYGLQTEPLSLPDKQPRIVYKSWGPCVKLQTCTHKHGEDWREWEGNIPPIQVLHEEHLVPLMVPKLHAGTSKHSSWFMLWWKSRSVLWHSWSEDVIMSTWSPFILVAKHRVCTDAWISIRCLQCLASSWFLYLILCSSWNLSCTVW